MEVLARVVVWGRPRSKGSRAIFLTDAAWKKAQREGRKPRPVSKEADATTDWVRLAGQVMAQELDRLTFPLDRPVAVDAVFYFPRPKSRKGERWHAIAPDGDKLARSFGDAGNAIGWKDDSRIVLWTIRKVYTDGPPCAVVLIGLPEAGDLPPAAPEP